MIGGVSISSPSGSPGTLGGVLEDVSANRFGLSCAHVLSSGDDVQQPSPKDNKGAAASIGRCVHSNTLISHVPPLNSYDPSINEIDAALVEFSQRASMEILGIGQLAGMANKTQVHTNMTVEVLGKEAGPETLVVGSTTLVHEFRFNGVMYGYRNLFVLRRASRHWGATGTLSPVKDGDSGGWVCKAGSNGAEWLGVIIGGDGPVGYAVPAEYVMDWLRNIPGIGILSVA